MKQIGYFCAFSNYHCSGDTVKHIVTRDECLSLLLVLCCFNFLYITTQTLTKQAVLPLALWGVGFTYFLMLFLKGFVLAQTLSGIWPDNEPENTKIEVQWCNQICAKQKYLSLRSDQQNVMQLHERCHTCTADKNNA